VNFRGKPCSNVVCKLDKTFFPWQQAFGTQNISCQTSVSCSMTMLAYLQLPHILLKSMVKLTKLNLNFTCLHAITYTNALPLNKTWNICPIFPVSSKFLIWQISFLIHLVFQKMSCEVKRNPGSMLPCRWTFSIKPWLFGMKCVLGNSQTFSNFDFSEVNCHRN
jgi:hypothetical protein